MEERPTSPPEHWAEHLKFINMYEEEDDIKDFKDDYIWFRAEQPTVLQKTSSATFEKTCSSTLEEKKDRAHARRQQWAAELGATRQEMQLKLAVAIAQRAAEFQMVRLERERDDAFEVVELVSKQFLATASSEANHRGGDLLIKKQDEIYELRQQRDRLQVSCSTLRKARDDAQEARVAAEAELRALRQDKDASSSSLKSTLEVAITERDTARGEAELSRRVRDAVETELRELREEKDAAALLVEAAIAERDEARGDAESSRRARDLAEAELRAYREAKDVSSSLEMKLDAAIANRDEARDEAQRARDAAVAELHALRESKDASYASLESKLEAASAEWDQARADAESARRARDAAETELRLVKEANSSLETKLEAAIAKRDEAKDEVQRACDAAEAELRILREEKETSSSLASKLAAAIAGRDEARADAEISRQARDAAETKLRAMRDEKEMYFSLESELEAAIAERDEARADAGGLRRVVERLSSELVTARKAARDPGRDAQNEIARMEAECVAARRERDSLHAKLRSATISLSTQRSEQRDVPAEFFRRDPAAFTMWAHYDIRSHHSGTRRQDDMNGHDSLSPSSSPSLSSSRHSVDNVCDRDRNADCRDEDAPTTPAGWHSATRYGWPPRHCLSSTSRFPNRDSLPAWVTRIAPYYTKADFDAVRLRCKQFEADLARANDRPDSTAAVKRSTQVRVTPQNEPLAGSELAGSVL